MDSDGRSPPPHLPTYFDPPYSGHMPYTSTSAAASSGALFGSTFHPYAAMLSPFSALAYPGLGLMSAGDFGSVPSLANSGNPGLYPLTFGGYSSPFASDFVNLGMSTAAAAALRSQSLTDGYGLTATAGKRGGTERAQVTSTSRRSPGSGRATPSSGESQLSGRESLASNGSSKLQPAASSRTPAAAEQTSFNQSPSPTASVASSAAFGGSALRTVAAAAAASGSKPTAVISHTSSLSKDGRVGSGSEPSPLTYAAASGHTQQEQPQSFSRKGSSKGSSVLPPYSQGQREGGCGPSPAALTSVIVSPASATRLHLSPPPQQQQVAHRRSTVIASAVDATGEVPSQSSPEGPLDLCAKKRPDPLSLILPPSPAAICTEEVAQAASSVRKSSLVGANNRSSGSVGPTLATSSSSSGSRALWQSSVASQNSREGERLPPVAKPRTALNGTPPLTALVVTEQPVPPVLSTAAVLPQRPTALSKYEALPNLKRYAEQVKLQKDRLASSAPGDIAGTGCLPREDALCPRVATSRKDEAATAAVAPAYSKPASKERKGRTKPLAADRPRNNLPPPPALKQLPTQQPQTPLLTHCQPVPAPLHLEEAEEEERKKQELRALLELQLKQQQHKIRLEKKARREQEKARRKINSEAPAKWSGDNRATMPDGSSVTELSAPRCTVSEGMEECDSNGDPDRPPQMDVAAQEEIASESRAPPAAVAAAVMKGKVKKRRKKKEKVGLLGLPKESPVPRRVGVKRAVFEENLRMPFASGWRRETRIRKINSRGRLLGEVHYYSPTDKKLRSCQDVVKYLEENGVTDLTKDNFSFSTRVRLGDFLEPQQSAVSADGGSDGRAASPLQPQYVALSNEQRDQKFVDASEKRVKQQNKVKRIRMKKMLSKEGSGGVTRPKVEEKKQRRQEASARLVEEKIRRRQQRLHQAELTRRAKEQKILERSAQIEQRKMDKQRRIEAVRAEKEMKTRMVVEARLRKKEDIRRSKLLTLAHKAQEKERKRIQALQLKATEARKKEEERERLRHEKQLARKRRLEQKHTDLLLARELRKPVEDLLVQETKVLPHIDRIPGLKLSGQTFANVLMTVEFCRNFGECLKLDLATMLPSVNILQSALIGDEAVSRAALSALVRSLLQVAVHDPGVVNPKKTKTALNQKLSEVPITDDNLSEILRIFLESRCPESTKLTRALATTPFTSLGSSAKAGALAVLCDELLSNKAVLDEIDGNLEKMASLRRSKWELEGGLRRLKAFQKKLFKQRPPRLSDAAAGSPGGCSATNASGAAGEHDEGGEVKESDEDGSGSESDAEKAEDDEAAAAAEAEECSETPEELEKRVDAQSKQHGQMRAKVYAASQKLRILPLGSDRHHRRYWLLPSFGGVLLESVESSGSVPWLAHGCDDSTAAETGIKGEDEAPKLKVEQEEQESGKWERLDSSQVDASTPRDGCSGRPLASAHFSLNTREPGERPQARASEASFAGDSEMPCNAKKNSLAAAFSDSAHLGGGAGFHGASHSSIASWLNSTIDSAYDEESDGGSRCMHGGDAAASPAGVSSSHSRAAAPFSLTSKVACDLLAAGRVGVASCNGTGHRREAVCSSSAVKQLWAREPASCDDDAGRRPRSEEGQSARQPLLLPNPRPIPQEAQRGWWRVTDYGQMKAVQRNLQQRGVREKQLLKALQKHGDLVAQSCSSCTGSSSKLDLVLDITEKDRQISQNPYNAPSSEDSDSGAKCGSLPSASGRIRAARRLLADVERLEDRVCTASMHVKTWTCLPKLFDGVASDVEPHLRDANGSSSSALLAVARQRLLSLESGIERRYLKPPLNKPTEVPLASVSSATVTTDSVALTSKEASATSEMVDEDETKAEDSRIAGGSSEPPGVVLWRDAVQKSVSAAQLQLCLVQLNDSVAWEKSIMRVRCQLCHHDNNEAQLLLCDSCDKGYHTYCFKPRMTNIPEGNWYCWECRSKAAAAAGGGGSYAHCLRCGGRTGKLAQCVICSLALHIDCMEPPQHRMPRKWYCANCSEAVPSRANKRRRSKAEDSSSDESDEEWSAHDTKKGKKEAGVTGVRDDMTSCKVLLADMEKQRQAWPFLQPVDAKSIPEYGKYIKRPMDLSTMRQKLKDSSYKSRNEFAIDARLMFDNCELFNEDDSEIGQAGHWMRRYFNKRWKELSGSTGDD